MRTGKRIDIIDKAFGDIIFTSTSRYGGSRTVENAMRYCHKHGYKIVEFEGGYNSQLDYVTKAVYVIPAEYSMIEEYKKAVEEKNRKAREEQKAEYTIRCKDGKEFKTSNLDWALKVIKLRGGAVYNADGFVEFIAQ